jgi:3'-5' exoribonuclease
MHTSRMLSIADFLTRLYPDVVNRDLVLTGTLCHDMAKDAEFAFSPAGLVTDYTVPGRLLGHSVMEAREIAELCAELSIPAEKSLLLQHLILSHHGQPEFGAAVIPQCAEAELLHHIDLIDSRMEIYAEELAHLDKGGVSGRVYALDKRIYRPNLD